jgi:hypothetical protein
VHTIETIPKTVDNEMQTIPPIERLLSGSGAMMIEVKERTRSE